MQAESGESVLYGIGHLVHQQFRDKVSPRANRPHDLTPVGGRYRLDGNGGPVDRLLVDAKVGVDRAAYSGIDGAFVDAVFEDAPVAGVGAPASEAGRVGKFFQGRDKTLAPPGATELCHVITPEPRCGAA